jgi:hypothetical protein
MVGYCVGDKVGYSVGESVGLRVGTGIVGERVGCSPKQEFCEL